MVVKNVTPCQRKHLFSFHIYPLRKVRCSEHMQFQQKTFHVLSLPLCCISILGMLKKGNHPLIGLRNHMKSTYPRGIGTKFHSFDLFAKHSYGVLHSETLVILKRARPSPRHHQRTKLIVPSPSLTGSKKISKKTDGLGGVGSHDGQINVK